MTIHFFSLEFFPFSQMIPTKDESGSVYLTKEDKSMVRHYDLHSSCMYNTVSCAEDTHCRTNSTPFTSQTDRPRLAHEVYFRWLTLSSPNNDNVTCTFQQRFLLNRNDLLIAAYTGSSLMYRK